MIRDVDVASALDGEQRPFATIDARLAAVAGAACQARDAATARDAREARRFAVVQSANERLERCTQTAQQLLNAGRVHLTERVRVGAAPVAEVRPLLDGAHALARLAARRHALFQRGMVEQAALPPQEVERLLLRVRGTQPALGGADRARLPLVFVNVLRDYLCADAPGCSDSIRPRPKRRQATAEMRKFFSPLAAGCACRSAHDLVHCRRGGEQTRTDEHDQASTRLKPGGECAHFYGGLRLALQRQRVRRVSPL